jgi:hypothetical protein
MADKTRQLVKPFVGTYHYSFAKHTIAQGDTSQPINLAVKARVIRSQSAQFNASESYIDRVRKELDLF